MSRIEIETSGIIRKSNEPEYIDNFVLIRDDREGSTGGYFIFTSQANNFKPGANFFDHWIQEHQLDQYFDETGWVVEWLGNKVSGTI